MTYISDADGPDSESLQLLLSHKVYSELSKLLNPLTGPVLVAHLL